MLDATRSDAFDAMTCLHLKMWLQVKCALVFSTQINKRLASKLKESAITIIRLIQLDDKELHSDAKLCVTVINRTVLGVFRYLSLSRSRIFATATLFLSCYGCCASKQGAWESSLSLKCGF